jgi:hypothetical protein
MLGSRYAILSIAIGLSTAQPVLAGSFCDDVSKLIAAADLGTLATSGFEKFKPARYDVGYKASAVPLGSFTDCLVTRLGPSESEFGEQVYRCPAPASERKTWGPVLAKFKECLGAWEVSEPTEYGPSAELFAEIQNGKKDFTLVFVPPEGHEDNDTG